MAFIGLQKGSGKRSRVREKSVKSQGILIWIMSGNPAFVFLYESHFTEKTALLVFPYSCYLSQRLNTILVLFTSHVTKSAHQGLFT